MESERHAPLAYPNQKVEGPSRRWTLNGDFLSLGTSGIARYGRQTALALDTLIGIRHPLTRHLAIDLVARSVPSDFYLRNIAIRIVPEWLPIPQLWTQLQLPHRISGGLVSLSNLAPLLVNKHIVCIHDVQTRTVPGSYDIGFRLAHRAILPLLGSRARAVTTVSEASRSLLDFYSVAKSAKTVVTYNGSDHTTQWESSKATLKFTSARPFILGFAHPRPYKNTELFWRIAARLKARNIDIVLVGNPPPEFTRNGAPLPENMRLPGSVSDADLALAMKNALCLLLPSRTEGFGLPAVEAMARGCPIIVSTAQSLPEVCGNAALFADPNRPDEWLTAIDRLIDPKTTVRTQMIALGLDQAKLYTWQSVAETYLRLMSDIDSESRT